RVVRAAIAAASTSGTEAIEGIPAPIGSVGFRWTAKWRSASQTPSSPCVSAISAIDIASANASSCVLPTRWSHSITRPTCIWASPPHRWNVSIAARLYCALGPYSFLGRRHMDVFDAIRTLLAVRGYQNKPIPEEVVRRIVEAGRLTGSGMNRQPWTFIVVRERETLRRLGALASSGSYVAQAPLAVVVATD